jgi:hypothetical protein
LATGFEDVLTLHSKQEEPDDNVFYEKMMIELYHSKRVENPEAHHEITFTVGTGTEEQMDNLPDENDDIEDEGSTDTVDYTDEELESLEDLDAKEPKIPEEDTEESKEEETIQKPHHMTFVERVKKKMFDIAMEMTSDERNNK